MQGCRAGEASRQDKEMFRHHLQQEPVKGMGPNMGHCPLPHTELCG